MTNPLQVFDLLLVSIVTADKKGTSAVSQKPVVDVEFERVPGVFEANQRFPPLPDAIQEKINNFSSFI